MRKIAMGVLLVAMMFAVQINPYAEVSGSVQISQESEDAGKESKSSNTEYKLLTMQDCMDKAVEHSYQTEIMDQQLVALWKQENALMEMSNGIQQQLDAMERYKQLFEKKKSGVSLTILEQEENMAYQYIFGPSPNEYTNEELFNNYIKSRDFPHYSVWATAKNMETNKASAIAAVRISTKQLFDNVVEMQEVIKLQQDIYDLMKKQNEQLQIKYNKGLVSEIDKYISEAALQKQKVEIEKLERTLDNTEMYLKKQIGEPLEQSIMLAPYENSKGIKPVSDYFTYLEGALSNRAEIVIAKMDMNVKVREDEIIKKYFINEEIDERVEAEHAVEEKNILYQEAVNNVTADILSGYRDVQLKRAEFYVAVSRLQSAEGQYKEAQQKYSEGLITSLDLWNIGISATQTRLTYSKAMRDYNIALYRLEAASGIGPAYTSDSGGI